MKPGNVIYFGRNSGEIAAKRLKLLLVSERAGCSSELLEMIQHDFLRSVSRYLEIDAGEFSLHVVRRPAEVYRGKIPAIYASIPIPELRK